MSPAEGVNALTGYTKFDSALVAEVFDDGPGFTRDALRDGHGLDMLERRLAALHGAGATLEIVSYPGGGAVRFRVPLAATA